MVDVSMLKGKSNIIQGNSSIIQGTDSELVLFLDKDVSKITWLEIIVSQGGMFSIKKGLDDVDVNLEDNLIVLPISVEESLKFSATSANLQVFYKLEDNVRTFGTLLTPFRIYPKIPIIVGENEEGTSDDNEDITNNTDSENTVDTSDNSDSEVDSGNTDSPNNEGG